MTDTPSPLQAQPEPVMVNGLTEAETSQTASVMGLVNRQPAADGAPTLPDPKWIYHASPNEGEDDLHLFADSGSIDEGCAECERLYTAAQMLTIYEQGRQQGRAQAAARAAEICKGLWRIDGQFTADEFATEVRADAGLPT